MHFRTRAAVLSGVEQYGCTYLVLVEEPHPSIEIHNHCPYTLYYGQMMQGIKQEGTHACCLAKVTILKIPVIEYIFQYILLHSVNICEISSGTLELSVNLGALQQGK